MSDPSFIEEPSPKVTVRLSFLPKNSETASVVACALEDAVAALAVYHTRDMSMPETHLLKHKAGVIVIDFSSIVAVSIEAASNITPDQVLTEVEKLTT